MASETGQQPGKRRRGRYTPRGRQVDPAVLAELREVLGERPRRRDLLIEHLHLIQDRHGCLPAPLLVALAEEMGLPLAEVYEVATFYAHFRVLKEGEEPPPPVVVQVCDSITCEMLGAKRLHAELASRLGPGARVEYAPCLGRCDRAPVAMFGRHFIDHAAPETVLEAVKADRRQPVLPRYRGFDAYVADGGYRLLHKYLALSAGPRELADRAREEGIATIAASGLRGLGGAGFPMARKAGFVRQFPGPRYLVVNADESEPGTFKDRYYLERDPHRFLEGMLLAAWAIEAAGIFIYLRNEYPDLREVLRREVRRIEAEGLTRGIVTDIDEAVPIELRRGAGMYICGEESAMLESIEGKRGFPRHKPPFPAEVGLFGRPTLINNVETLYWLRDILERGPEWFASAGRHGSKGMRSFSVSGRVKEPGVKLAPAGITVRELIDEHCGGMAEGHTLKAYLPGGASGGIFPASMADIPLDFGAFEPHGGFIGSAAIVVLSQEDSAREAVHNLLRFFAHESCGQCTPCRVGTTKAVQLMSQPRWDAALLEELGYVLADASICGLGQAAANPIRMMLKHFADELELKPGEPQGHPEAPAGTYRQ